VCAPCHHGGRVRTAHYPRKAQGPSWLGGQGPFASRGGATCANSLSETPPYLPQQGTPTDEEPPDHGLLGDERSKEEVLDSDAVMVERADLLVRSREYTARLVGEALSHVATYVRCG
jgi:hypothetical protein